MRPCETLLSRWSRSSVAPRFQYTSGVCIAPTLLFWARAFLESVTSKSLCSRDRKEAAMAMSVLAPNQISKKGQLENNVWLAGSVVRTRDRAPTGASLEKGKEKGKGNGKGKSKKFSSRNVAADQPRSGFEVYLNGGSAPNDVMMVEAWVPEAVQKLKAAVGDAEGGSVIRVTNGIIKEHNEKTSPWTTSRHPLYLTLGKDAKVEAATAGHEWLPHHPTTPIDDLVVLPDNTLVCIEGKVHEKGRKSMQIVGSDTVPVINFTLRCGNELVALAAWRELAGMPEDLEEGDFYQINAVKKVCQKGTDTKVQLRYTSLTVQSSCSEAARAKLEAAMTNEAGACTKWSDTGSAVRRDFDKEVSHWFTLSVCSAFTNSDQRRKLTVLAKVPSVFISNRGGEVAYAACGECKKALQQDGTKRCSCTSDERMTCWKATFSLMDDSGQLTAKCFEEIADLIPFHSEDHEDADPGTYLNSMAKVDALMESIAAVPFTVLLSFEDSEYSERIEPQIRRITLTTAEMHPCKQLLRCNTDGQSCPPSALRDVAFRAGVGCGIIGSKAVQTFRSLLKIMDKAKGLERENENSPAVCCARKVACALHVAGDAVEYKLTQTGPIDVVSRLLIPQKGALIHALVGLRPDNVLILFAFYVVPTEDVDGFQKLFEIEAGLYKDQDGQKVLPQADVSTPVRTQHAAMDAAALLSTPKPFGKRPRVEV